MSSSSTLPPGIEGELQFFTSGGDDAKWMPFTKQKYYTNAFIVQNGKVGLIVPQGLDGLGSDLLRFYWGTRNEDLESICTRELSI
jgi:8-oxo-dGTP diphosphatase/2-hydroxy-dATP diphosphatase